MLTGKTVIVVGGAGAIGTTTCELFAQHHANVVVADFNLKGARDLADRLSQTGATAVAMGIDVSDASQVQSVVEQTMKRFGRLDGFVNLAAALAGEDGIFYDTDAVGVPKRVWDKTMAVDLEGAWHCTRFAVEAMLASGGGSLVHVTSTASFNPPEGRFFAFAVARAGVNQMVRHVARSYRTQRIRCNAAALGPIDTDALWRNSGLVRPADIETSTEYGRTIDVANVLLFLVSDMSRHVNGERIVVSGGTVLS